MAKSSKQAESTTEAYDFTVSMGSDLRLPKLSHLVAGRLREQIVSGKLKPGSLLMPESQLLAIFKVSRPTLREALRILESESLISVGRGMRSGALVLGPSIQKATEFASFILVNEGVTMYELHEARMLFEPEIVRSLSGPGLEKTKAELRGCVEEMQAALAARRYADAIAGTNRLHEILVTASGNKAIALLNGMLRAISNEVYVSVLNGRNGPEEALRENMSKTIAGYVTLCDLLETGKVAEAGDFWRKFMVRSAAFLKRSKIAGRKLLPSNVEGAGSASPV